MLSNGHDPCDTGGSKIIDGRYKEKIRQPFDDCYPRDASPIMLLEMMVLEMRAAVYSAHRRMVPSGG